MKYIFTILMLSLSCSLSAQKSLKKADRAFDKFEYYDAIEHYINYLSDNKNDNNARAKLAECYLNTNQYLLAEEQLGLLESMFSTRPKLQLNYGQVLQLNGNIEKAKVQAEQYLKSNKNDEAGLLLLKSCNQMEIFLSNKNNFDIRKKDFSQGTSNFSPVYHQDHIVYTTDQGGKIDRWTGRSYSNIYTYNPATGMSSAIKGNLNGKYHNGVVSFIDDHLMIYTRNSEKKNNNNDYNLLLAEATFENEEWNFSKYFAYNNEEKYNVAYPAVDEKGSVLIFASDMAGGAGGWDLYQCTRSGDGWTPPVNLDKINTAGNEMFPNISGDRLTFSSDGYAGMGGLDIFQTDVNLTNPPVNIGAPFNSHRDDFGLITQDKMKSGFFCSNRDDDTGLDHIYEFEKNAESLLLSGIVLDEYTKIPLKETVVSLVNILDGTSQSFTTGIDGRFNFDVLSDQAYNLSGIKNAIKTSEENIDLRLAESQDGELYFKLLHNDPRFSLEGYTQNSTDQSGVPDVNVSRFNSTKNKNEIAISEPNGFFKFQLEQESDFEISGEKDGHYTSVSSASTKGLNRSKTLYVKLFLTMEEVIIGETKILGKEKIGGWSFDPIYYDLDKDNIRPDAALVLDKLVDFLKQNPGLIIELGSHTDARGKDKYNEDLSSRRAASAVKYLVTQGISPSRLQSKGYGEYALVNGCSNGIQCDESMHQLNRRTEIKVIGNN